MIELEKLKSSGHFHEISLSKGDVLFKEGDQDTRLYIVYSGELAVQKSVLLHKGQFKTLSLLSTGNIVGEASLSNKEPKQVQIVANTDTVLLGIDGENDFKKFVTAFPEIGYALLTSIIEIGNSRLVKANSQLSANYEVNIAISKIKDISLQSIFKLLLVFEAILGVDQIMYFEKNLVMDEYYKLRYNSRNKKSIMNMILKFPGEELDLKKLTDESIEICKYTRHISLSLGEEHYGFLLIGKDDRDFQENEEKLLQNTAASFVAVIHQKRILDDTKNKNYVKSAL